MVLDCLIGWLNQNSGAVQGAATVALICVTGYYAWQTKRTSDDTRRLADATRRQADASVNMAEEMQKQRLEGLRPIIDVTLSSHNAGFEWIRLGVGITQGMFPTKVDCEVSNIGVGPALEVEVSLLHPTQVFEAYVGGTLPKESGPFTVTLAEKTVPEASQSGPNGCSLVANYADVYGRKWRSKRDLFFNKDKGAIEHGHLIPTLEEA